MTQKFKLSCAVAALTVGVAAPALAEIKYENASGGSVQFYGQFSPAYISVDDGVSSTSEAVDNAHSGSRVGVKVLQPMGEGTFSFTFETALGLRSSAGVSQTSVPKGVDWDRTDLRKIDFAYKTASYGTFSVGQGSMATDGIAEADFGGTGMALYNGIGDAAGSFAFRTAAGALSGVTIGDVTPSLDGARRGRVRYDSPDFNGFRVSVAAGTDILSQNNNDDYYDIALRYGTEIGTTKVSGGVGFSRRERNGVDRDDTLGSVAVELQNGLNFAVAAGNRKGSGDYAYGKIGYNANFLKAGQTSFGIDYYQGNDFNSVGSESKSYGVAVNQDIDSLNTQVYLGYRTYELTEVGTAYRDIDSVIFGARWRF
jgi:hypothetical protein